MIRVPGILINLSFLIIRVPGILINLSFLTAATARQTALEPHAVMNVSDVGHESVFLN